MTEAIRTHAERESAPLLPSFQSVQRANAFVAEMRKKPMEEQRAAVDALRQSLGSDFDPANREKVLMLQTLAKLCGVQLAVDGLFGVRSKYAAELIGFPLPASAPLVRSRQAYSEDSVRRFMDKQFQPKFVDVTSPQEPGSNLDDAPERIRSLEWKSPTLLPVADNPQTIQTESSSSESPETLRENRERFEKYAKERLKSLAKVVLDNEAGVIRTYPYASPNSVGHIVLSTWEKLPPAEAEKKLEGLITIMEQTWRFRLPEWAEKKLEWQSQTIAERYSHLERQLAQGGGADNRKLERFQEAVTLVNATDLPERLKIKTIEGYLNAGSDSVARVVEIIRSLTLAWGVLDSFPEASGKVGESGLFESILQQYASFTIDDQEFARQLRIISGADILKGETKVNPEYAEKLTRLRQSNPTLIAKIFVEQGDSAGVNSKQLSEFLVSAEKHIDFISTYRSRILATDHSKYPWIGGVAGLEALANQIDTNIVWSVNSGKVEVKLSEYSKLFSDPSVFDSVQSALQTIGDTKMRDSAAREFSKGNVTSLDRLRAFGISESIKEKIGTVELASTSLLSPKSAEAFRNALNDLPKKMGKQVDGAMVDTYLQLDKKITSLLTGGSLPNVDLIRNSLVDPALFNGIVIGKFPPKNLDFALDAIANIPAYASSPDIYSELVVRLLCGKDFTNQAEIQNFHEAVSSLKGGKFPLLPKDRVYTLLVNRAKWNISAEEFSKITTALGQAEASYRAKHITEKEWRDMSDRLATSFELLHGDEKFRSMLSPENAAYITGKYMENPPYFSESKYPGLTPIVRDALTNGMIGEGEVTYLMDALLKSSTPENQKFSALSKRDQQTLLDAILSGKMGYRAIDNAGNALSIPERIGFVLDNAPSVLGPNGIFKRPLNANMKLYDAHDIAIRTSFLNGYITNSTKLDSLVEGYNSGGMNSIAMSGSVGITVFAASQSEILKVDKAIGLK